MLELDLLVSERVKVLNMCLVHECHSDKKIIMQLDMIISMIQTFIRFDIGNETIFSVLQIIFYASNCTCSLKNLLLHKGKCTSMFQTLE